MVCGTATPFTTSEVRPPTSGVLSYRLLWLWFGTRTRTLKFFATLGFTVMATLPFQGYSVACTISTSVPPTFSTVMALPTNRLTYTPSALLAYTQVGIMSSVRGMLPTQQGQLCQGVRGSASSSGLV